MADASLSLYLATPHRLLLKFTAATGSSDPKNPAVLTQADLLKLCVSQVEASKGVAPLKAAIAAWPTVSTVEAAIDAVFKPEQGADAQALKKPSVVKRRMTTNTLVGAPVTFFFEPVANKPALSVIGADDALVELALVHTVNG